MSLEERNQGAIELLRSWREEGDEQEQTETAEYLRKALDEDRLSKRLLANSQMVSPLTSETSKPVFLT